MQSIEGTIVSEDHVAAHLGFSSVEEFRRWQTDAGHKLAEAEHAMKQSQDEARRFRWNGLRMMAVLARVAPKIQEDFELSKAVAVVLGREVDWGNDCERFFKEDTGAQGTVNPDDVWPTAYVVGSREYHFIIDRVYFDLHKAIGYCDSRKNRDCEWQVRAVTNGLEYWDWKTVHRTEKVKS